MVTEHITATLDPDVIEQLKTLARRRDISFEAALNTTIRAGLAAEHGEQTTYRVASRPMGLRSGIDLTHAANLADSLDDEENIRKLELGK